MTFREDFYFGNLKGYSSALFTNPAGKQLTVNIRFSDPEQQEKLQSLLQAADLKTDYHIHQYELTQEKLYFQWCSFAEQYSVEDISAFVTWFFPLLTEYGISGIRVYPECGKGFVNISCLPTKQAFFGRYSSVFREWFCGASLSQKVMWYP